MKERCPFCRSAFKYTSARETHIRREHGEPLYREWIRSVRKRHTGTNKAGSRLLPNIDIGSQLPKEDWLTGSIPMELYHDEYRRDSNNKPNSAETHNEELLQTRIFLGAGTPIPEDPPVSPNQESQERVNTWYPFENEQEFYLAEWFIVNKISKTAIDDYFKQGFGNPGPESSGQVTPYGRK